MKKTIIFDIVFIIALGGLLVILSETNMLDLLMKYPFFTILTFYYIGRYITYSIKRKK